MPRKVITMENAIIKDHPNSDTLDLFGFWIYILSDCILFATLFAAFVVLRNNLYGGAGFKQFINLHYVLIETLALLTSSFTYGLAIISFYQKKFMTTVSWLMATLLLGFTFIYLELSEFVQLYQDGYTWQHSAALSSFFTLVGTHGLHVFIGLIWLTVMVFQLFSFGLTDNMRKRMTYLGLFWAFLDIVWVFVFTIVYLMGVM
jgi:cytochrome o ubiquinol oxidase subunit 3